MGRKRKHDPRADRIMSAGMWKDYERRCSEWDRRGFVRDVPKELKAVLKRRKEVV